MLVAIEMMLIVFGMILITILFCALILGILLARGPPLTMIMAKLLKKRVLRIVTPTGNLMYTTVKMLAGGAISRDFGVISSIPHALLHIDGWGNTGIGYSNVNPMLNIKDAYTVQQILKKGKTLKGEKLTLENIQKEHPDLIKGELLDLHQAVQHLEYNSKQTPRQIEDMLAVTEKRAREEATKPGGGKPFPTGIIVVIIIILMVVMLVGFLGPTLFSGLGGFMSGIIPSI